MPLIDDLSSFLAGGGAVLVGWLLGRVSRPQRSSQGQKRPTYRCVSCGDGFGYHEDGGRCHEVDFDGDRCKCRKYIGETPPPSYDEIIKGMP